MPPCRFCSHNAHEYLCLDCRTKFDLILEENARLKKDIEYLKGLARRAMYEQKAEMAQAAQQPSKKVAKPRPMR